MFAERMAVGLADPWAGSASGGRPRRRTAGRRRGRRGERGGGRGQRLSSRSVRGSNLRLPKKSCWLGEKGDHPPLCIRVLACSSQTFHTKKNSMGAIKKNIGVSGARNDCHPLASIHLVDASHIYKRGINLRIIKIFTTMIKSSTRRLAGGMADK